MADQKLTVRFDGNSKGAEAAANRTVSAVKKTAAETRKSASNMAGAYSALGRALTTVGIMAFAKSAVESAIKAEASQKQLANAIKATGADFDALKPRIDKSLSSLSDLSAYSKGQLREGLTALITVTGDTSKSLDKMQLVADLARRKKMDLASAAQLVGKVMNGNTAILKRAIGIDASKLSSDQALALMQERLAGSAQAYGDSAQGQIEKLNNAVSQIRTEVGTALLPVVKDLATEITSIARAFGSLPAPIKGAIVKLSLLALAMSAVKASGMPAMIGWLAKTVLPMLTAASADAAAATALLAGGESVLAVAGLGGAAAAATAGLAALGVVAAGAVGYGIGTLIVKIGEMTVGLDKMGETAATAFSFLTFGGDYNDPNKKFNSLEKWMYGLGDAAEQTTPSARKLAETHEQLRIAASGGVKPVEQFSGAIKLLTSNSHGLAGAQDASAAAIDRNTRAMNGQMVAADDLSGVTRTLTDLELGAKEASLNLSDAQAAYNDALKKNGPKSKETQRAQIALTRAQESSADAAADLKTAVEKYGKTAATAAKDLSLKERLDAERDAAIRLVGALQSAARESLSINGPHNAQGVRTGGRTAGPQLATGGWVHGPSSGYPATLHDTELVTSFDPRYRMQNIANSLMALTRLGAGSLVQASSAPIIQISTPGTEADFVATTVRRELNKPRIPSLA